MIKLPIWKQSSVRLLSAYELFAAILNQLYWIGLEKFEKLEEFEEWWASNRENLWWSQF